MHGICHFEFPSVDMEKSKEFYSKVFGWEFKDIGDPNYVVFSTPDGPGGGIEKADVGSGSNIKIYIEVEDIPSTLAKAEQLGGKIVKEKTLISEEHGFWGMLADPCGVQIGIWSKK